MRWSAPGIFKPFSVMNTLYRLYMVSLVTIVPLHFDTYPSHLLNRDLCFLFANWNEQFFSFIFCLETFDSGVRMNPSYLLQGCKYCDISPKFWRKIICISVPNVIFREEIWSNRYFWWFFFFFSWFIADILVTFHTSPCHALLPHLSTPCAKLKKLIACEWLKLEAHNLEWWQGTTRARLPLLRCVQIMYI